jgi:hypothetical protein
MTNEKWWAEEPYMTRGLYKDYYHFEKIVAEATRRGEVKALEEAMTSIKSSHMNVCGNPQLVQDVNASVKLFKLALVRRIDAKLTSLNKV